MCSVPWAWLLQTSIRCAQYTHVFTSPRLVKGLTSNLLLVRFCEQWKMKSIQWKSLILLEGGQKLIFNDHDLKSLNCEDWKFWAHLTWIQPERPCGHRAPGQADDEHRDRASQIRAGHLHASPQGEDVQPERVCQDFPLGMDRHLKDGAWVTAVATLARHTGSTLHDPQW